MIPVRVHLRNFLCYGEADSGEPIEFDFEGSRLWSISGDNGAGKSAIFDAITYTLFGQHRGGAQEDSRLIRKGADGCEAIFEFRLDGRLFRVRRTVSRPRGKARVEPKTWQAAWFDPEAGDWRAVPETETKTGLERWVREKLGFGYETFVASVLLLQGQSDQLILARPKKRFEILSGLLDLEPYERLEAAAQDRMRRARDEAKRLEGQLASLPTVTSEEIKQAKQAVRACDRALKGSRTAVTQAELALSEARRYAKLQTDLSETKGKLTEVQGLLREGERIRREYEEWRSLSDAVPKLRAALQDLRDAEAKGAEARAAHEKAASIDLDVLQRAAAEAEEGEREAEERARQLRGERDQVAEALPLLRDVLRARQGLSQREAALADHGVAAGWEKQVREREQAHQEAQEAKREAENRQRAADQALAQAKAAFEQAEAQLKARREARDEGVCSRCGQPISKEHIQKELQEAERLVAETKGWLEEAKRQQADAKATLEAAAEDEERARYRLEEARRKLETAERLEDERERASAGLDGALAAAESVPDNLLAAVAGASLAEAGKAVEGLGKRLGGLRKQAQGAEAEEVQAREERRRAQQAYEDGRIERQRLEAEAERLNEAARGLRGKAEARLIDVSAEWRESVMAHNGAFVEDLSGRLSALEGVQERHTALQEAETEQQRLEAEIKALDKQIGGVRPEYRLPVAEAKCRRDEAEERLKQAQDRRDKAQDKVRRLEESAEQRKQVEADLDAAGRQRSLYARLAELLGRSGLQAFLLDAAVQRIAQLANETLSRISGGQLQLQIQRQASAREDEEIVIQAVDLASSDEPLDVQFVSGSQKFRASVALAAGIGQYAGHGAGSVRSLIIDEGFGSLDSQGRQEMIDELRNLSQLMERLIVVSHQEDFQDRTLFPTGYVLRKAGQHVEVERFV